MVADEDGIDALFRRLDALPLVDQARLQANRFAATQLELDIDDDNVPESIFLTIEFPLSGELNDATVVGVRYQDIPIFRETEIFRFPDFHFRHHPRGPELSVGCELLNLPVPVDYEYGSEIGGVD